MLFSTYCFILVFLPLSLIGYHFAGRIGATAAAAWLTLCSLGFYAIWNLNFVPLLLTSIVINFAIGQILLHPERRGVLSPRIWLAIGVVGNLLPLVYFKYLGAIVSFVAGADAWSAASLYLILPLGISFFTFTQIGYLVDCHQGQGKELDIVRYALFVSFFPHLAAGPLLHVREIAPQLLQLSTYRLRSENLAYGATYFVLGLSKKIMLADPLASFVGLSFTHPDASAFLSSWLATIAFSFQLYFDFSGYSDMAIGLAAMFGMKFPLNFDSPHKAACVIDFWRRWHMTLTRYLTLLLYNPIGLWITRHRLEKGLPLFRRGSATLGAFLSTVAAPIFLTMTLAGVWHGAGLQFLVFGLLHASYLTINHAWQVFGPPPRSTTPRISAAAINAAGVVVTFVAILVANVFFRASSIADATLLLRSMLGLKGFLSPLDAMAPSNLEFAACFIIVWGLPNSEQIMQKFLASAESERPARPRRLAWSYAAGTLLACDLLMLQDSRVFLYFQF